MNEPEMEDWIGGMKVSGPEGGCKAEIVCKVERGEKFEQEDRVPPKVEKWKITNDRCERCHNECRTVKSCEIVTWP